jgi:DedD protein
MALFKLRKGRDEPPVPVAPAQTVEAMRRRAMHRLIGAAILVLAGVIGFPALFDNQPRPIPVDLPIVIPDKANVPALVAPAATVVNAASPPPAASAPVVPPPAAPAPAPVVPPAVVVEAPRPSPPVVAAKPAPASADVPAVPNKPVPTRVDDAGKARDLLEGKEPGSKAVAAEGRFIVQVGAFSDADKVREVRLKVEALGLKTYTQVIDTKDGSRTRVRVGPFTDMAEATRTAEKIRKLGVPASILSL